MVNLIGIEFVGEQNKIGPVIGVCVNLQPDFFRRWSFLNLHRPDKLTKPELNKIVELTMKHVDFNIVKIEPRLIMDSDELKEIEFGFVIDLLNRTPKFWKNKIYINNSLTAGDRDLFVKGLKAQLPTNLSDIEPELNMDKWTIMEDCTKKTAELAACYAQYYLDKELDEIRSIWGELDSITDPECPHIKRLSNGNNKKN